MRLKLETSKLLHLTPEEIESIWRLRTRNKRKNKNTITNFKVFMFQTIYISLNAITFLSKSINNLSPNFINSFFSNKKLHYYSDISFIIFLLGTYMIKLFIFRLKLALFSKVSLLYAKKMGCQTGKGNFIIYVVFKFLKKVMVANEILEHFLKIDLKLLISNRLRIELSRRLTFVTFKVIPFVSSHFLNVTKYKVCKYVLNISRLCREFSCSSLNSRHINK
uniref:Uncharacterized protein n=1 Tax=Heterorhabditis bacteriophora TaxID=37862 RepID=A0A1I7WC91_HETBA